MRIRQIAMVTVQVRDFAKMVTWYRDVLGFSVGWYEPDEFCTLVTEEESGAVLALATDHPERIGHQTGVGWTPTISVDDLDATVAHLRSQDVEFLGEEEGGDEGYRLVRVRDPEGNTIGLTI
jgi:catechol 2,3-dioxygenase-like lactoylglutathione lyase family enzyme